MAFGLIAGWISSSCSRIDEAGSSYSVTKGDFYDTSVHWAPSGNRFSFTRRWGGTEGGTAALFIQVPGEPAQQITVDGAWNNGGAWSPDGKMLAYASNRGSDSQIWVVRIADRKAWPVTEGPGTKGQPDWSPDGRTIAFHGDALGSYDIWQVDLESGATQPLMDGPGLDASPRWSPDGTRIVFRSDQDTGNFDLWTLDVTDGSLHRWTSHPAADYLPIWAPDGHSLVFISTRGGNADIWRLRLDAGNPPELLVSGPLAESMPALSPDGRVLLYTVFDDGRYLFETEIETLRTRRVLDYRGADQPDLSSGGDQLAYVSQGRIWVSTPPSPPRVLTPDSLETTSPKWSPTADSVYFLSGRNLWQVAASGKADPEQQTRSGDVVEIVRCPDSGPVFVLKQQNGGPLSLHRLDGRLSFITEAPAGALTNWTCIGRDGPFLLPVDDSASIQVLSFDPQAGRYSAVASPALTTADEFLLGDGRIVLATHEYRNRELVLLTGSEPVRLTSSPGNEASPTWSPDGTKILYSLNVGRSNVHAVALE